VTGEELKERNIAAMGEDAGTQYSLLNNEVAILHLYWKEYVELFSTNQKRVDRLNQTAPGFSLGCTRRTRAELRGYQRAFNKASVRNWGTRAQPCPTLNVVKSASGTCRGIAFEFPEANEREVRDYLIEREGKAFPLRILPIRLDDGSVAEAAVPVYEGKNIIAARDLHVLEKMVRDARGTDGSGIEYVQGVANELKRAGIDDPVVAELAARITHHSK
jgi:cation transport protein ChaC